MNTLCAYILHREPYHPTADIEIVSDMERTCFCHLEGVNFKLALDFEISF